MRTFVRGAALALAVIFAALTAHALSAVPMAELLRAFRGDGEPVCPECGAGPHVVPWSYGLPDRKAEVWSSPGPHGGCGITSDSPKWHCNNCGRDWGRFRLP